MLPRQDKLNAEQTLPPCRNYPGIAKLKWRKDTSILRATISRKRCVGWKTRGLHENAGRESAAFENGFGESGGGFLELHFAADVRRLRR